MACALVVTYVFCPAAPSRSQSVGDSCNNQCGANAGTCWCDTWCTLYGDCCTDYSEQCPNITAPMHPASCQDNCGGNAGPCWCDGLCSQYGDCCSDFAEQCAAIATPAAVPGSCQDNCGGHAETCWCDTLCTKYGDCCTDYSELCAAPAPTVVASVAAAGQPALATFPGNVNAALGATVLADLTLDAPTSTVEAGLFRISYDPDVLHVTNVGIGNGCLGNFNAWTPGLVIVAFACLESLPSTSAPITLQFVAMAVGSTGLYLDQCRLNEGDPGCAATDGGVTVTLPAP